MDNHLGILESHNSQSPEAVLNTIPCPHKRLRAAMLMRVFRDLQPHECNSAEVIRDAKDYIIGENVDPEGLSFKDLCDGLGLDYRSTRKKFMGLF